MLDRVEWFIDVSEEHYASIFRVKEVPEAYITSCHGVISHKTSVFVIII
jgi:hypothetical protein